MSTYRGRCHCGAVRIEATTSLADPFTCNCSFCARRGAVLQKVEPEHFRLTAGESELTRYGARDFSDHYFCSRCGIHVFTRITRKNETSVAVNLACLDGVDLTSLSPRVFDGAKLL